MSLFSLFLILFVICFIVQYMALHRQAFGRGLFIQIAMIFFVGLVYLAPEAPRWLVWTLFIIVFAFTLFMTFYSMSRMRKK